MSGVKPTLEPILNLRVPCHAMTHPPYEHFYGYYEKNPWDPTQHYLLAMQVDFNGRLVGPGDKATVGVIDLHAAKTFIPLASTTAWNWQQGAMLQWLANNEGRQIIYNDRHDDRFIAVVHDLTTATQRVLPMPIYTITQDSTTALCLDFTWLGRTRGGYGYAETTPTPAATLDLDHNGIYQMDIATGTTKLILSYSDIIAFQPHPAMHKATHWVEHLLINPTDERFMFLHRFDLGHGNIFTRLLTANLDGSHLHYLTGGMVSHYCWRDPQQIFAWARERSLDQQIQTRRLIQRIPFKKALLNWLHRQKGWMRQQFIGDAFRLFTDLTQEVEKIGVGIITEDGHPTFSPNFQWILLDTYPDAERYRHLYLYHFASQQRVDLGRFYSPQQMDGGWRCDLHPRWSPDGRQICIDSGHDGTRQMYTLDVGELIDQYA